MTNWNKYAILYKMLALEKFTIVGPSPGPEVNAEVISLLASPDRMYDNKIPPEATKTSEQEAGLAEIIDVTARYLAEELGIDASAHLPTVERFHILPVDTLRNFSDELERKTPEGIDLYGFPLRSGDLIIADGFPNADLFHIAQHELLHTLTREFHRLHVDEEKRSVSARFIREGFIPTETGALTQVGEWAVEDTNLAIEDQYWSQNKELSRYAPTLLGHRDAMHFGAVLVRAMSRSTAENPEVITKRLQQAYFLGNTRILPEVQEVIGLKHMRRLAYADPASIGTLAMDVIVDLQL